MKKLIHDIHSGKNLKSSLPAYKKLAVRTYREYAALELTFSAYMLLEENESEESFRPSGREKEILEAVKSILGDMGSERAEEPDGSSEKTISAMCELRREITDRMDLFTAYTDRLICYQYVLNRMELRYIPPEELSGKISGTDEDKFLRDLMLYLFGNRDQSVIKEKLRTVIGQIPIHMTKTKFFEKIGEALTLYEGGPRSDLEDFLYMLRTAAMVYEPKNHVGEYTAFEETLKRLEETDYSELPAEKYDELTELLETASRDIFEITDFYYSVQRVVNCIYALCLMSSYKEKDSGIMEQERVVWSALAKGECRSGMLEPLEGNIEECAEKSSYLESVLFEIKNSYSRELEQLEMTEFFSDLVRTANLLSDSLFIDLEKADSGEKADAAYLKKRREALYEELSARFAKAPRPLKRAMMGQVLEKLPLTFQNAQEVEQYIRTNLFGCQDKSEKYVVMDILQSLIMEEQSWE